MLKETMRDGREKLGAFNVALFYSILRAQGCNPHIRDGGLYMELRPTEADMWAALHDPAGTARLDYARSAWIWRLPGTEIVELG